MRLTVHRTSLATEPASRLRQRQDLLVAHARLSAHGKGQHELLQVAIRGPFVLGFDHARIQVCGQRHCITASRFHDAILSNKTSPITYNAPKPKEITDEDKIIEAYKINVRPANVTIVPVAKVFE